MVPRAGGCGSPSESPPGSPERDERRTALRSVQVAIQTGKLFIVADRGAPSSPSLGRAAPSAVPDRSGDAGAGMPGPGRAGCRGGRARRARSGHRRRGCARRSGCCGRRPGCCGRRPGCCGRSGRRRQPCGPGRRPGRAVLAARTPLSRKPRWTSRPGSGRARTGHAGPRPPAPDLPNPTLRHGPPTSVAASSGRSPARATLTEAFPRGVAVEISPASPRSSGCTLVAVIAMISIALLLPSTWRRLAVVPARPRVPTRAAEPARTHPGGRLVADRPAVPDDVARFAAEVAVAAERAAATAARRRASGRSPATPSTTRGPRTRRPTGPPAGSTRPPPTR